MVAYSGCHVVSAGSFAWRRREEEESEGKEKEETERKWNVPIFRQHELYPDHMPPSIVTLLAIESRRHQRPVPNGGVSEGMYRAFPVVFIHLPQAPAYGPLHDAGSRNAGSAYKSLCRKHSGQKQKIFAMHTQIPTPIG